MSAEVPPAITPAPYSVKVRVENGRNGSAECVANLRIEERPNRPPVIACSADRSTVTQGDPVTITANANDPDTEHGVPSDNMETRALGDEDNLTPEQVKKLVDDNPDLSGDERRKIDSNLRVIVWANNRRVDVSLNTTGQQSVRQFRLTRKIRLRS